MNTEKVPEHFKADVEKAKHVLKNHGCKEIYLCGSDKAARANSVIELGVRGLDPDEFYHAYGEIYLELEHRSRMIDFGNHKSRFEFLQAEGECLRIG